MAQDVHYFGIRHHGPGSAARLVDGLNRLSPSVVLVEGPSDCSDLFPLLADKAMQPPVALLAYTTESDSCSVYFPFAEYSPEYQACLWAVDNQAELSFIDLPVAVQLAQMLEKSEGEEIADAQEDESTEAKDTPVAADPIGVLAELAGYEDGEAWWNDLIEENADDSLAIFEVVEQAITALRGFVDPQDPRLIRDLPREASMRLAIAKAAKDADGPVAVVCGAWHVPALREKHTAKDDRACLRDAPTKLAPSKVRVAWVPWTSPRLSIAAGYGAGVRAPMWYQHLWHYQEQPNAIESWATNVARRMRERGQIVSTASIIETIRLSHSLAAVRNRPSSGFEEIRDAIIACMCFGEALVWRELETSILLGNDVGEIPPDAPLAPLLEDLQRWQKKCRLKPEALPKEIALDLRSDAGSQKSILLHRLNALEVPWGRLIDPGKSRGTFRERWQLEWTPEYAVRLVENLVYGSTIEQAAGRRLIEAFNSETHLANLAAMVQNALAAMLEDAAQCGLRRIDDRAAHVGDCDELLDSLPPLVDISRYGTARKISIEHISVLSERLAVQAAIALPYALRNLDAEEAQRYWNAVSAAHAAIQTAEFHADVTDAWWRAMKDVVDSDQSSPKLAGLCVRLLYEAERISAEQLQDVLSRMLSPGHAAAEAATFFDGFFTNAADRMLYDDVLLQAVKSWIARLDRDPFIEYLPLMRRVFSNLDSMERRRMLDAMQRGTSGMGNLALTVNNEAATLWPAHVERIGRLLRGEKTWANS